MGSVVGGVDEVHEGPGRESARATVPGMIGRNHRPGTVHTASRIGQINQVATGLRFLQ